MVGYAVSFVWFELLGIRDYADIFPAGLPELWLFSFIHLFSFPVNLGC